MTLLGKLLKLRQPDDQRRGTRREWPQLVAHYWTGAAPKAISVQSISSSGMYLLTEERWYPGTVVKITLQRTDEPVDGSDHSIAVHSRVVHRDANGVGLEFILAKNPLRQTDQSQQDFIADRKCMDRFVERLFDGDSKMFLEIE